MTLFISSFFFILNWMTGSSDVRKDTLPDTKIAASAEDTLHLSKYKGKVVILNFWASWSKASRVENKNLVRIYQKYKNSNKVAFVSVSLDTDAESWKTAIDEDEMEWAHHYCDFRKYESPVAKQYKITTLPVICVYDKNGNLFKSVSKVQDIETVIDSMVK